MRNAVAALVLAALFATTASAGNGISSISTIKHRSLTSCAIKAYVSGDDDSNAVLRIFQRWTGNNYDTGMVMVRREGSTIHEGRILWMTPGRTAQWYIQAVDPTSGTTTTTADTASCAVIRPIPSGGTVYYVNQATGNNANAGTTAASPKRTFNTNASVDGGAPGALAKLLSDDLPNSGIIVAPGHYHEALSINSGTDGYFHFIIGSSVTPDSTIICGANEHGEADRRDVTNSFSWSLRGYSTSASPPAYDAAALGVYKAYLPTAAVGSSYGDSVGSVTVGFGEYLHRKTSLLALYADSTGTASSGNLAAGGVGHGYFLYGDTLYVRRPGLGSPAGVGLHIGYRGPLLDIRKRNWHISRITVRYSGGLLTCRNTANTLNVNCIDPTAQYSSEDPPNSNYEGVVAGTNANASGLVVDSCRFYGNTGPGVYARYSALGQVADSVTVANSAFDGLTIGSAGYAGSKGRIDENASGIVVVGSATNVYNNTVTEVSNGIGTSPVAGSGDSTWAQNMEVAGNVMTRYNDDGIETDATHCLNQLIIGNRTQTGSSGISTTTLYMPSGPMFVIENSFTQFRSAGIKIGDGARARLLLYQNTFASQVPPGVNDVRAFEGMSGGTVNNVTAYNNIFLSSTSANNGVVSGPSGIGMGSNLTNAFNYNLLFGGSVARMVEWGVNDTETAFTFAAWQATGQETNGVNAWPMLTDLSRGNVQPKRTSPANSAGRRITGVNTSLDGNRYTGSTPHIGAVRCVTCAGPR